ncbi:MAG: acylphosphatase [Actinobacteria bacterium]|nr:MAG: acylphosphatase [Actinomycetota bacterium]
MAKPWGEPPESGAGTLRRAHVVVHGAVQGVFFRVEARDRASSLGIGGWVQNMSDGSVEAVFEGDDDRVESMVDWCRRGPRGARVDDVDVTWDEPQGENGFSIR